MVEPTCEFMYIVETMGKAIKIVRLDQVIENYKLEKRYATADWKKLQPIEFEFTSHNTPHHNNLAELAFPYMRGKACAMM